MSSSLHRGGKTYLKVSDVDGLPVIQGDATSLVRLATAVTAAVRHREAVVCKSGVALIGVQLVDDEEIGCPCVGTPDQEDCPHE